MYKSQSTSTTKKLPEKAWCAKRQPTTSKAEDDENQIKTEQLSNFTGNQMVTAITGNTKVASQS